MKKTGEIINSEIKHKSMDGESRQVETTVRQKQQLVDRIETYDSKTFGHCKCGMPVMRINGSDQTNYTDKTRYYYLNEKSTWGHQPSPILSQKAIKEINKFERIPVTSNYNADVFKLKI